VRPTTPRVLDAPAGSATPLDLDEEGTSRRSAGSRSGAGGSSRSGGARRGSSSRRSSSAKKGGMRARSSVGFKLLVSLAVAIVLSGGIIALYFSPAFPITNVTVAGNSKLQSGYVIKLADVAEGSTFFRVDVESIRARLLTEPWIQDVSVERGFPDTVVLRITEQPIAAVVSIVPGTANDSIQQWVIAMDGTWIAMVEDDVVGHARINAEELVRLTKIRDISAAVRPVPGMIETDEGISNALALLRGFSPEMRGMVSVIAAPDAVRTNLTLSNNVGVAFGAAEDIEAKERAIATLLAEHEGTITFINVRVADHATYRATE